MGTAEHLRTALGIPIHVHPHEAQRLRGAASGASPFANVSSVLPNVWRPKTAGFAAQALRRGYFKPRWVQYASVGGLDADILLPGHGEPWRGHPTTAVEQARARLS